MDDIIADGDSELTDINSPFAWLAVAVAQLKYHSKGINFAISAGRQKWKKTMKREVRSLR